MAAVDAIGLAIEVSRILTKYVQAYEGVDETIRDCQVQVDGLAQVLRNVSDVLASLEFEKLRVPGSDGLRESIPILITNCYETLQNTARAVNNLRTSGSSNAWKRNWRAIKLMYSHGALEEQLSSLKTHSLNLQMAVTTANLIIAVHSPRALASEQNQHFERLEHMLTQISDKVNIDTKPGAPKSAAVAYLDNLKTDANTKTLTACAMQAISSASTVRGLSVSGKTLVAEDEPAFDFLGGKKELDSKPAAYQESTTGSEYGGPFSEGKSSEVLEWIQESSAPDTSPSISPVSREDSSKTTTSQSSLGSVLASITSGWTRGGPAAASADPASLFNEDADEGEEFEIAQRKFAQATDQLASHNLTSASRLFQDGFEFANELPTKSQEKLDLAGMKLKYATSCSSVIGSAATETTLLEVMQIPPTTSNLLEQNLTATHEMAQLKLQENHLASAEDCCRQALKGRRQARSIGSKHPDYYASLKLLVDILSAKNDFRTARQYAELLPHDVKGDLDRRLAILESTKESRPSERLEPPPPPLPPRPRSPLRYPSADAYELGNGS